MIRRLFQIALVFAAMLVTVTALHAQNDCPLPPRLVVGETAWVTPGLPNNIRAQPGKSGQYLGQIPPGEFFTVLEGPTCSSGLNWWRVRYNNIEGWTPEGDAGEYWVEPQRLIPTALPTATLSTIATATITPTLAPFFATAAAMGYTLQASSNAGNPFISVRFNDVEMVLVRAGCYQRSVTEQQALVLAQICELSGEQTVCSAAEYRVNNGEVCFNQPFWIDRYEVAHLQYETYLNHADTPHQFNFVRWSDDHPRGDVLYEDAVRHCFLRGSRIPTDVEWEYAARGPQSWLFPWGDVYEAAQGVNNLTAEKFYNSDGSFLIKPVVVNDELLTAGDISWAGAYHLSGNVAEWVTATLPDERFAYTVRGGSANRTPLAMRTHSWPAPKPYVGDVYVGFRCVREFRMEDLALVSG